MYRHDDHIQGILFSRSQTVHVRPIPMPTKVVVTKAGKKRRTHILNHNMAGLIRSRNELSQQDNGFSFRLESIVRRKD